MRITLFLSALFVLAACGLIAFWTASAQDRNQTDSGRPELEYFKAINRVGPPQDPQLLFLLMADYSNANLQGEGAEFLADRLKEFGPRITDGQKSLYLSAIATLRGQHASSVALLQRFGYVKDTIAMLDQAKHLSGGNIFVVNWIGGIVRAELPGIFRQKDAAAADLAWCAANADKAPHAGWLREVYFHQGKLALADGDKAKAQQYLKQSGYTDFDRPITLTTPLSEDAIQGHAFSPRRIENIVPGRVYALSGFEFTEYYFVVSDDGRQLIGIDAGTRPDSAKTAYEALRAYAPGLPELTTIFITHSHWDHIGGHTYFDSLTPRPRFYARSNYQEEIAKDLQAPSAFDKAFFGQRFNADDVRSFKPDVTVDRRTELKIGGTRIELIPIYGGETHDAMLIHLPDLGTMFAGDVIMPYLGAPFSAEGDFDGLLDAIDIIVDRHPQHLLQGHMPLTQVFSSSAILAQLKPDLVWLREQVLSGIRRGDERGTIQNANLIPPGFLQSQPDEYLPYFVLRAHAIDRLYDQNTGYWKADLEGLDHLTRADRAALLVDYLGVSEAQTVKAADRLIADGKYELAASLIESLGNGFPQSEAIAKAKRLVYLKLMEQKQNTDPFEFIIYSAKIGEHTPQINGTK